MKEALYYTKVKDRVQCRLCPRLCLISEGMRGNCGVRENKSNKLFSIVYGRAVSAGADPIEKKPLYHFLPGTNAFSIGTAGCNLHCLYCQNWEISQVKPEDVPGKNLMPLDVVEKAKEDCKSIAYTYTEPTIAIEYCMDTAKASGKLKNVIVSNGFINKKPLVDFCNVLDGANIDLKSFNDKFYKKFTGSSIKPVLDSLRILKRKVWLEITYLVIPGLNDKIDEIKVMCEWIKDHLGRDTPLHFSRFFPMYKMLDKPATDEKTLLNIYEVAKKYLDYVYVGNLKTKRGENTYCPKCGELAIGRDGFRIVQNNIKHGKCKCGEEIAGVWE